jgi:predicted ArsR family transcriptional regulator
VTVPHARTDPRADRREEVLEILRSSTSPMTILDIARRLGLHANTVRFHLQVLEESGRVERVEPSRTAPGRPPLMFRAHRGMDPTGPRNYQLLAEVLLTRLDLDAAEGTTEDTTEEAGQNAWEEAIEAGRVWGQRIARSAGDATPTNAGEATDRLVGILDDLGFSPELRSSAGETQIGLRHCPFLDMVPRHSAVICPMHLGLMQGAMTAMDATVSVDRLDPFVEPDLCLAHVG